MIAINCKIKWCWRYYYIREIMWSIVYLFVISATFFGLSAGDLSEFTAFLWIFVSITLISLLKARTDQHTIEDFYNEVVNSEKP